MRESAFQDKLIKALESQGAWVLNIHGHMMQMVGVPDLLILHKHWKGFLEVKVNSTVKPIQKKVIRDILRVGFPAFVIRWCGDHVRLQSVEGIDLEIYADVRETLPRLIERTRKSHMKTIVDSLRSMSIEPTIDGGSVSWGNCKMQFYDNEDVML